MVVAAEVMVVGESAAASGVAEIAAGEKAVANSATVGAGSA